MKLLLSMLTASSFLLADEPKQEMPPIPQIEEKIASPKESWFFISASGLGILPIPSGLAFSYRKMTRGHGFEVNLESAYRLSWSYVSLEGAYLPYWHTKSNSGTKAYFGVGAGVNAFRYETTRKEKTYPSFYVLPGIQMPLNGSKRIEQKIECKIGFPTGVALTYGIGF